MNEIKSISIMKLLILNKKICFCLKKRYNNKIILFKSLEIYIFILYSECRVKISAELKFFELNGHTRD